MTVSDRREIRDFLWHIAIALWAALAMISPSSIAAADTLAVVLDQAKIVKMPERVATIVVGNPLIADVSLQPGGMMVITGKGYGVTNLVALDRSGATLMEKSVRVEGPGKDVVFVYLGTERQSYSCTPNCERRITLGDTQPYFDATLSQAGNRSGQAQGGAQAPK